MGSVIGYTKAGADGQFTSKAGLDADTAAKVNDTASNTRNALNDAYGGRGFLGASFAFLGDSITNYGEGYPYYAQLLSKGALVATHVKSNPGKDSTFILSVIDAQVINATPKPATCLVLCGANDAQSNTPLATYKANVIAMVGKLRGAGIIPVLGTVPPNNNDTYDGFVRTYNAWISRYAEANRIPLVDFYSLLVDPVTGDWRAGYDNGDGLHPNNPANKVMGQLVYDTLKPMLSPRPYLLQTVPGSPNVSANSSFLVDTNADGLADSLSATASTGFTYSLVADPAGFNWQRITLDGTAVGLKQILSDEYRTPNFTVGERIRFAARVRNGQAGNKTILQITCYTAAYGVTLNTILTSPVPNGMTQQIDGVAFAEFVIPTGTEIIGWALQGEGVGTYDVAQPTWYNVTKLGLD